MNLPLILAQLPQGRSLVLSIEERWLGEHGEDKYRYRANFAGYSAISIAPDGAIEGALYAYNRAKDAGLTS